MRIDGGHVLLTGATGTVGAALTRSFRAAGARVTAVARTAADLEALAAATGAAPWPADLTDPHDLRTLVARVEDAHGPVDVLVNNAGVEAVGPLTGLSADDLARVVALNLTAPAELARQVLPGMLARGHGALVDVSSLAGVAGVPGLTLYAATKAGLTSLSEGLRLDLTGTPVTTVAVEVGPVRSEMMARIGEHGPAGASFARLATLRLLRDVDPEEVAGAVVDAVRRDRRSVRLPRRTAPVAAVAGAPRALMRLVLTGIGAPVAPRSEAGARR